MSSSMSTKPSEGSLTDKVVEVKHNMQGSDNIPQLMGDIDSTSSRDQSTATGMMMDTPPTAATSCVSSTASPFSLLDESNNTSSDSETPPKNAIVSSTTTAPSLLENEQGRVGKRSKREKLTSHTVAVSMVSSGMFGMFLLEVFSIRALFALGGVMTANGMLAFLIYKLLLLEYQSILSGNGFGQFLPESIFKELTQKSLHEWLTAENAELTEYQFFMLYFVPGLKREELDAYVRKLKPKHRKLLKQKGLGHLLGPKFMKFLLGENNIKKQTLPALRHSTSVDSSIMLTNQNDIIQDTTTSTRATVRTTNLSTRLNFDSDAFNNNNNDAAVGPEITILDDGNLPVLPPPTSIRTRAIQLVAHNVDDEHFESDDEHDDDDDNHPDIDHKKMIIEALNKTVTAQVLGVSNMITTWIVYHPTLLSTIIKAGTYTSILSMTSIMSLSGLHYCRYGGSASMAAFSNKRTLSGFLAATTYRTTSHIQTSIPSMILLGTGLIGGITAGFTMLLRSTLKKRLMLSSSFDKSSESQKENDSTDKVST